MTSPAIAVTGFSPTPPAKRSAEVAIEVARSVPPGTGTVDLPVAA